jgi:membrane protein required for colicin V production
MTLDLIFGLVLVLMIGLGAWRGAVISGSGLVALIGGYAGAIFVAMHFSDWVAQTLVISPLVAPAIAGTIGFFVVWLVVSAISDVVVAWDRQRIELGGRGPIDRGLGGFFGLVRGGLIVVLLGVLSSWLDAARDMGVVEGLSAMPDAESSRLTDATSNLVEVTLSRALSGAGPAGVVAARITARPGQALGSVQIILEDERLNQMFEDRLFWTLIMNDSIDYAMNRSAVRAIVYDSELRGRFVDLGLVGEEAREKPEVFRAAMAGVFSEVAPRVQRLHQDPEMKALAEDPEIIELVQSGDTLALISHPRIQRMVERVSSDL